LIVWLTRGFVYDQLDFFVFDRFHNEPTAGKEIGSSADNAHIVDGQRQFAFVLQTQSASQQHASNEKPPAR
jgi:hypothetical protein